MKNLLLLLYGQIHKGVTKSVAITASPVHIRQDIIYRILGIVLRLYVQ